MAIVAKKTQRGSCSLNPSVAIAIISSNASEICGDNVVRDLCSGGMHTVSDIHDRPTRESNVAKETRVAVAINSWYK